MNETNESSREGRQVLSSQWEDDLRRGQEAEGERGSVEPELALLHLMRHARQPEALDPGALDEIWSQVDLELAPAQPWWRQAWLWWAAPVAAAAAVLVVVVLDPSADEASPEVAVSQTGEASSKSALEAPGASAPRGGGARDKVAVEAARVRNFAPAPMADERRADIAEEKSEDAEQEKQSGSGVEVGSARLGAQNGFESSYIQFAPGGRVAITVAVDTSRDELRGRLLARAQGETR